MVEECEVVVARNAVDGAEAGGAKSPEEVFCE